MTKVLAAAKQLPMSPEQANVIFFFTPGIETWTLGISVRSSPGVVRVLCQ